MKRRVVSTTTLKVTNKVLITKIFIGDYLFCNPKTHGLIDIALGLWHYYGLVFYGSNTVIHTLLPLSPKGEICDINGNCVDAAEDELFRLTTKEGKLTVERETFRTPTADFSPILQFEQDPVQILDALLPLYLNSQILRALQESLSSELAARMSAMSSASDNASDLKKSLSMVYNRKRQAKITGEILEIVAGANAQV